MREQRTRGILTSGRGNLRPHSRGSQLSNDFVKQNVSLASRLQTNAYTYDIRKDVVDYSWFYIDQNYSRDIMMLTI